MPALWHTLATDAVIQEAGSDAQQGLSDGEVTKRREQYGKNELKQGKKISPWKILLEQFQNVLIVILLIAVALSAVLGQELEAIAIVVIVLFAVFLGFIQEYKAERAMEALKKMTAPEATVIRGGKEQSIPASELVPGDIILIATGSKIPADGRIIESSNFYVAESVLTGESSAVAKFTGVLTQETCPLGDRTNMVYGGTTATYGRGKAIVTATGMQTEFGKIAQMLQDVEQIRTPLQDNLDHVGSVLARIAFAIVLVIVGLGLLRGQPFLEILLFGIALAVAVVPEALPAVVTISLAIGVQRMVKRNALIRKLPAVETLGSTSVICSDKTGTLTKDEMTVRKIFLMAVPRDGEAVLRGQMIDVTGAGYAPEGEFQGIGTGDESLQQLLAAGALCNDAHLVQEEGKWSIRGDPTEGGFVVAAAKAGLSKEELEKKCPRIDEVPFTSESKRMTTIHEKDGGKIAYAKGAPEIIADACTLSPEEKQKVLDAAEHMAKDALRVLAVACCRDVPVGRLPKFDQDMQFLGLIGMIDPPRPEVKKAVDVCRRAGIHPIMITGDHPLTAEAIARELGILTDGYAVTGEDLDAMSTKKFTDVVEKIQVYARVSPEHKLHIITAWQEKGHVVAMTGDGVNDAPALKKANIGIAMGITGTDVTKEAADMTLMDDNFTSIVAAVEEGRGIFGNIKKYLMYLLSANLGEIGIVLGATVFGLPLPFTALQILFINLATDGLPAIALSVDPPEKDLMKQKPRDAKQSIFTKPVVSLMCLGGLWSTILNTGLFWWLLQRGTELSKAMTMIFVTLVFIELWKAYIFRSDHRPVWEGIFSNKWLNLSVLAGILPLVAVVIVPVLQLPFRTVSLSPSEWLLLAALAATTVPVVEVGKWVVRQSV
ncbi:ATPase [Candidatus Peregrinibacteria bacterium CG10_big_fil_rev_8_21_14_0_10_49_16]|nr:MAG: ATPase [Candidatus Peregrinibacteria bacterium CG22_combo_CG10-13_8_21_14_all_49_11]PIR51799.1 MAG: ATPase [Candidatus Peregrinibacteria bacterium CG10_big_fil_rev_8_21_14_0_10_49_16]